MLDQVLALRVIRTLAVAQSILPNLLAFLKSELAEGMYWEHSFGMNPKASLDSHSASIQASHGCLGGPEETDYTASSLTYLHGCMGSGGSDST